MRRADAPAAGWYPDPEGGTRLRWWDGTDWSDRWRSRPVPPLAMGPTASAGQFADAVGEAVRNAGRTVSPAGLRPPRIEQRELVEQVRQATRAEMTRGAEMLGRQARDAARHIEPLIGQYTNRLTGLVRRLLLIVVAVLVFWFVFRAIAEVTFLQWLGDRIDNLFDGDSLPRGPTTT
jgi:hypothetical protein